MSNNNWNSWNPNYPAQQAPQQNKTSPWVYSIVAISVVALLVAGVLTATAVMGKDSGDGEESPVAAETVASKKSSESPATTTEREKTSEAEPTPEDEPTPEAPRGSGSSSPEYRLSSYGWEGSPAHCNADDQWLYAAYGDGDYVVVCKVGERGDYYYRSYVGGHSIEKDVDMSYADPSRGSYSVPVGGGTRIEINQKDLKVYEHGEVASNVTFDQFFVVDR